MEDERETSSLRQRIRKSSMSLSCCFNGHRIEGFESTDEKLSPIRSPSVWLRSPEIKGRCRNLISRMGGGRHRRHSADFSYDPLSYALNFDGGAEDDDEFAAARNFSSRLPREIPAMRSVTPPPRAETGMSVTPPATARAVLSRREIVAFS